MAARAEGVNQAMLSILKKMDAMVSATKLAEDNSLILLGSIETVVKNDVSLELKKHTSLLSDLKSVFGISAELMNRIEQHSVIQNSLLSSIEVKVAKLSNTKSENGGGKANDGGLGGLIGSIPEALMQLIKVLGLAYVFGKFIKIGALNIQQAMVTLLSISKAIDPMIALTTLTMFGLVNKSKLREFVDYLTSTFTIKNWFLSKFWSGIATKISEITQILLFTGYGIDPVSAAISLLSFNMIVKSSLIEYVNNLIIPLFTIKNWFLSKFWPGMATKISEVTQILLNTGRGIDLQTSVISVLAFNILSRSKIGELVNALSMTFMSNLFSVGSLSERATDLSGAVRILLKTSSRLSPETIAKSVLAIGVLAASDIAKLVKALTPGFLSNLFSKPGVLTRRAEDLSGGVKAILNTSKDIDNETAIRSVLSFTLIAYSVDILISALRRAALWNPFIILGMKITNKAIRSLLEGIGEVTKDSQNLLQAAVFVVALSFSIGTLLSMCVVAGLLAPIVLIGSMVLGFMVRKFTEINTQITKSGIKPEGLESMLLIASMIAVLVGAAVTIIAFSTENSPGTVAMNVIMFGITIWLMTEMTLMLAKRIKEEHKEIGFLDILGTALAGLIQAVTLILVSQAMKNPPESLKAVLLFGLMTFILTMNTILVMREMSKSGTTKGSLIAITLFILGLVLITALVVKFSREIGPSGVLDVLVFGVMIGMIGWIAKEVASMLSKSIGGIIKSILALTIFVLGALFIGALVNMFAENVSPISVLFLGLAVGLIAFIAHEIGKNWKTVALGALALSLTALSILFFTYSLAMFQSINLQLTDILLLGGAFAVTGMAMYLFGENWKMIGLGAMVLAFTSISILILAYALTKFKEAGLEVGDAILLGAIVAGLGIAMKIAGDNFVEIGLGAGAMIIAGIALITIAAGVLIFKKANITTEDALILGGIVVGLGLAMAAAGAGSLFIALGAAAMILAGGAVAAISLGLIVYKNADLSADDATTLGSVIRQMALNMAIAGAASPLILLGAIAMTAASVALLPLSGALAVYKMAGMTVTDADSLGASVKSLATSMMVAGLGSPLILLGSVAMTAASVALLPISGALAVFKTSGFTKEDGDNLEYGLSSIINGFLGGKFPGGVLEGLKFAGQAAARAGLLLITVPGMILAGVALITISSGLSSFKKAGFTVEDGVALESTIGSIAKAFTLVTDKERQKKLGINIDPIDLMTGILSLSMAGNVLSSLAEGVKAWANLEVNEYEVIGAGTSKAKLVIKSRRKLGESDFSNAANGMAKVITAIAEPFALVGRLDKGQPSGNPLYDMVFGGGFVSAGIAALKNSGDTIVSLAEGVRQFATMQFVEFEVVNAGTSKAKLVPKGVTRLGEKEIESAGNSIATIIGVVAKAFSDVGRDEAASEGVFSGGFVAKGVSALAGVGENLKNIVDSVLMMAKREIPTFDLINGGTSKAKLVPGKPKVISDKDLTNAATTIMDILKVIATGFYDIGKMEDDSSSFWGDGYIAKGIKAISGVGDVVAKVTDSVIKIATGTITPMTAVGSGTNTKLVPGTPVNISGAMLKAAARTLNSIMLIMGTGVYNFGLFYKQHADTIDGAIDVMPDMVKVISKMAEGVNTFAKLESVDKATLNFQNFTGAIFKIFDPELNKGLPKKLEYMDKFTSNIVTMASPKNSLDKLAVNFDKIQNSMKLFTGHVNSMDLEKLTTTDSLMKSLAIMSKSPEVIGEKIAESIEQAFKDLLDGLKKINEGSGETEGATAESSAPTAAAKPAAMTTGAKPAATAAPGKPGMSITSKDIEKAMVSALSQVTVKVKPTPGFGP